ncbi:MAG: PEP-CTERM sorting domain-containing protein [Phycisphaerae bacterium]|nr:PEP-CTERM sorting domain-containing protein [Phycisphaerae bacterium]
MRNRRNPRVPFEGHGKGNRGFLCLLMVSCLCGISQAGLYSLTKVTNNGPGLAIDPWQFTVDVQYYSDTQVLLEFVNNNTIPPMTSAPLDSSIAAVYIDDTLISFDSFIGLQTGTIEFLDKGTAKMPGGTSYGFTKYDFYAGADNPAPTLGLNPGESLGLLFDLNGSTYADINTAIGNGSLRVGLHVISIEYGDSNVSESLIVPEPVTLILLGLGGLCTRSYKYRRR